MAEGERMSIYRASRSIKRRDNSLYNALRSIYHDSIFVSEIAQLWPDLPLLANLRCGLWYSSLFHGTCYFKSTDGHSNNCSFSTSRLNLHVAHLAGQKGGCIIVDSTRKGKRFPDSMTRTIPIWTCVLNRAIDNHRRKFAEESLSKEQEINACLAASDAGHTPYDWDCSLHLPLWVSENEKAAIGDRLEEWTKQLEATGTDMGSLASTLRKPLRPLWISQKTVIWLNEVPDCDSWNFTPVILVSASSSSGIIQQGTTSEFSWHYIPGAGDDEESWARGLSPNLFWKHVFDLINSGSDFCNQSVADIVEKDRVHRGQRGQNAPQITVKPQKLLPYNDEDSLVSSPLLHSQDSNNHISVGPLVEQCSVSWLGCTNLAVGATQDVANNIEDINCILNCDSELSICLPRTDAYLHLPILTSKLDRTSLLSNLPSALNFAKSSLSRGKRVLVCCSNGEDISVCVCLAILISLFDEEGSFDNGKSFEDHSITKWEMRRRLVFICKFATNARPSRGNLKQVFNFLIRDEVSPVC
ncbi:Initiator tRNA phosphoribosyl transferase [Cinnamomum micranthum f. kanehirae]|uniref:Initiator tRNA phosphoribosyl transferase n=1 Tax=Cinnamomum micranthum f. kanehirae TaxID=337451 RepID=A0A443N4U1_9MAGN|nr:Initiator tRNA phosphoribosyl transferase [Cinnamomum micranthum f. kanehirae]